MAFEKETGDYGIVLPLFGFLPFSFFFFFFG